MHHQEMNKLVYEIFQHPVSWHARKNSLLNKINLKSLDESRNPLIMVYMCPFIA
uniref:Uncharacterized protein n=1 Tax=Anguilla anguilla TaxID=7936 RepID=A0A0E9UMT5_ANGAN